MQPPRLREWVVYPFTCRLVESSAFANIDLKVDWEMGRGDVVPVVCSSGLPVYMVGCWIALKYSCQMVTGSKRGFSVDGSGINTSLPDDCKVFDQRRWKRSPFSVTATSPRVECLVWSNSLLFLEPGWRPSKTQRTLVRAPPSTPGSLDGTSRT